MSPPDSGSPAFADHFSSVADGYARSRPRYPEALFDWLATLPARRALAWDVGTGNGQAALGLARHFARVIATDASAAQLAAAAPHPAVRYELAPAAASGQSPGTVDLVTVAQALHWFDLPSFYAEVARVLHPGGAIAAWTYGPPGFAEPAVDAAFLTFTRLMGPWWPPERRLVDTGYRTLPFPFAEVATPALALTAEWTVAEVAAYLRTWSAVTRFAAATGADPVVQVEARLARVWGAPGTARRVSWPLAVRAGRLLQRSGTR